MNRLYKDRSQEELDFIDEVCKYILQTSIEFHKKEKSDEFAAIFVEGRDREINTLEDLASIYSFKRFSKHNYPVFMFVNNKNNIINKNYSYEGYLKNTWRINVIEIPKIESLEDYSKFCINELYFKLPPGIENVITLQPDAMLLKSGWEDFLIDGQFDWLSPHWKHLAQVEIKYDNKWYLPKEFAPTCVGGGGFSFRKVSKMQHISIAIEKLQKLGIREFGRMDNREPMEDLFFTYFGFNMEILKFPKLLDCDRFACDPLTRKIWTDKEKWPFGFHFFKTVSEFPDCQHN